MTLNNFSSTSGASADVDSAAADVWRATAGSSVRIPTTGSRVYYFPQGHFEQCSISASTYAAAVRGGGNGGGGGALNKPVAISPPPPAFFHCRVVSVRLMFHPVTDQPFACLQLVPIPGGLAATVSSGGCDVFGNTGGGGLNSGGVSNSSYSSNGGVFGSGGGGFSSGDVFGNSGGGGGGFSSGKVFSNSGGGGGGFGSGNVFGNSGGSGGCSSGNVFSNSGGVGEGFRSANVLGNSGGGFRSGDVFGSSGGGGDVENVEEDDVVSFTKVLTPSDANNGGGFSVPRYCADAIFPALDFEADPPVQTLVIRDVHGSPYEFRHIYRGTPRRHLLTTGWSKFVNSKQLVAGDSVVFMRRRRTGELYAGVRRALRGGDDEVAEAWRSRFMSVKVEKNKENDWAIGKGIPVEAVLDCLEKAVGGLPFEVVFYPRPGWSEFIVKAETVEKVMLVCWTDGMKVKMPMETEDSTKTTWFHGTVSSVTVPENEPWRGSPWRMLEMSWDEPEILQHANRVSPWQVENVLHSYFDVAFPPTKRFKLWEDSQFLPSGGDLAFPMTGFSNSLKGPLTTLYSDHTFYPASMQGARQIQECRSFFSEIQKNDIHKRNSENGVGGSLPFDTLSRELNIGSLLSDTSSVDNSTSFNGMGTEGKQDCSSTTKVGKRSFQLFGKTIGMEQPVEDSGGNKECSS